MSALAECCELSYYYYEIQYFYLLIYFIFKSGREKEKERESEKKEMGLYNTFKRAFKHEIQTNTISTASTLCKIPNKPNESMTMMTINGYMKKKNYIGILYRKK